MTTRLAAALSVAALAVPAAASCAVRSARYTVDIRVTGRVPVHVTGTGTLAADRGLASLAFSMRAAGLTKPGSAVLDARRGFVAYVRGPGTAAPPAKPWAAFRGLASRPFFDPGVAVRLATRAHGTTRARIVVPDAERRRLFPSTATQHVVADLWLDARGRVTRLRASARARTTDHPLIAIDERLTSYGGSARISVPPPRSVYLRLP